jgi:hypothetical protein
MEMCSRYTNLVESVVSVFVVSEDGSLIPNSLRLLWDMLVGTLISKENMSLNAYK